MKKRSTKITAICLTAACLLPATTGMWASAAELPPATAQVQSQAGVLTETAESRELINPRFKYITRISSGLSISKNGYADCTGSYTINEEYPGTTTMTLQRYADGQWSDVKEWSEDYPDSGVKMLNKGYYVTSGYRYRMITTVEIKSGSTVVERESCDSPTKEY